MAAPLDNLFTREFERKDGSILKINQCEVGDVGCVVWDSALVLSYFLETKYFTELCDGKVRGQNMIELGAGTGLVGIQAACLGIDTVISDLPDFVPLMALNIETNKTQVKGSLEAKSLSWGEDVSEFLPPKDFVMLADCIYYEESIEPLVKTLVNLSDHHTTVLCCYEERTTDNKPQLQKLFFELVSHHFTITEVPLEKQDPCFSSPDIHIMVFKKR